MNRVLREKKGFTLVELAIVLVIVGLLLGMGANLIGPLMKKAKTIETNDIVNAAVDSIVGYALVNKKLPQWTDLNDANIAVTEFHYSLRNYKDAWGTPLFYAYDNNLFTTNICTRTTTNLTVRKCNDSACTPPPTATDTSNVAYIVYSRGENFNYQTISPVAAATFAYIYDRDVIMNNDRVSGNIAIPNNIYPPTNNVNDPVDNGCAAGETRCQYDDIVRYMTLNELKTKIGCTSVDTCTATGIILTNNSGSSLYYKRNGGACTPLMTGATVTVLTIDYYDIFSSTDTTCTGSPICPVSITLFHLSNFDINRNCSVRMASGCSLADQ